MYGIFLVSLGNLKMLKFMEKYFWRPRQEEGTKFCTLQYKIVLYQCTVLYVLYTQYCICHFLHLSPIFSNEEPVEVTWTGEKKSIMSYIFFLATKRLYYEKTKKQFTCCPSPNFVYVVLSEKWLPKNICRKIAWSLCRNFAGTLKNSNLSELCPRLLASHSHRGGWRSRHATNTAPHNLAARGCAGLYDCTYV